ncbi:MAG: hypothetical protein ABW095_02000, partial [Candidatus Thiodiazotropha sp.]
MNHNSRLPHFPISFFAMVMGLAGLCIAWEKAQVGYHLPFRLDLALIPFTALVFTILALTYLMKLLRYPGEVVKELNHPVKLNFFPAVSISKRVFDLMKDFGTSKSTKIDSIFDSLLV